VTYGTPLTLGAASGNTPLTAAGEVVELAAQLIRIDTTNTGDSATSVGERAAAEFVAAKLAEVGIGAQLFESVPGRTSLVARIPGQDRTRGGLVMHGHLDVVPAVAADWQVPPFSGEIRDGYLWGRGAVDMKNMDAMILAVIRQWVREGRKPPRDVVLAFFADEEAGGLLGAWYMVKHHPELFEGCTEAIGEVGGFSITLAGDRRIYPIMTGEKGMAWTRLSVQGRAGHGSMIHPDNAVTLLAEAVARVGRHTFATQLGPTVRAFLRQAAAALEVEFDESDPAAIVAKLGPAARIIGATLCDTANPTMLAAGYKANVIPGSATAVVDCRILPGHEEQFERELDALLGPDVTREWITYTTPLEIEPHQPLMNVMAQCITEADSGATVAPYLLSGGTDAKPLASLGIACYGFAPMRLPAELDFTALFHGVDERVDVQALRFGVGVLDQFLARC
jgi:acetylornithine deacetylase/succinyl-diaminopimelate desuccinylase-like protein